MKRRLFGLVGLVWALGAVAECSPRLQIPSVHKVPGRIAADLAEGKRVEQSITVRVADAEGCAGLLLGAELAGNPTHGIVAQVRSAPNGTEIGSDPMGRLPLLPLVNPTQSSNVTVALTKSGQVLTADTHELQVRWRLFPAEGLLPQPLDELDTRLDVNVPPVLNVTLTSNDATVALAGAVALLDFGELNRGDRRNLWVQIEGNTDAQLSVLPQWRELRLRDRPDYAIPYTLMVNGQVQHGDTPIWLPMDPNSGQAKAQLEVVIGDVERRAAGIYQDVLLLTVAPE